MNNYTWNFDLDTHPVHTLMSLSGLRTEMRKIRCFTSDGTYTSFSKGVDALTAEKDWIKQLTDYYSNNQDSIFCLAKITGTNKDNCKILDQTLLDTGSFYDFLKQVNIHYRTQDLALKPFIFIEQITSDGSVYVHILFKINLTPLANVSSLSDMVDTAQLFNAQLYYTQLYAALYSLAEEGGFFQHEYGIYPYDNLNNIIINTHNNIHDGILIHTTEYPWQQKKYEYIGNLQGVAALIIMISAVLFINEIVSLPLGWIIFALILLIGVLFFIRSRKNTRQ